MNLKNACNWSAPVDLERVVEPLASYISACERPQAALMTALSVLISEVERTNRSAFAHVASMSTNRWL